MKTYEFHKLAESMEVLEAKEMLRDIKVAIFPNLKKKAQEELSKDLLRVAKKLDAPAKELSSKQIAQQLGFV